MTPCPPADAIVNSVARQAGANPITVPKQGDAKHDTSNTTNDVASSPTGVDDISIYPSWTDTKEAPSWYAKGADVDALLDVADTLDWLADPGDAHETYEAPPSLQQHTLSASNTSMLQLMQDESHSDAAHHHHLDDGGVKVSGSVGSLPRVDSSIDGLDPSLPALFPSESTTNLLDDDVVASSLKEGTAAAPAAAGDDLQVFDTPMEEQAFVSTLLTSDHVPDSLVSFSP